MSLQLGSSATGLLNLQISDATAKGTKKTAPVPGTISVPATELFDADADLLDG